MEIFPIKTRLINPPQDDLWSAILEAAPNLKEQDILVVASKVVAIAEGRCVPKEGVDKEALAKSEAEWYVSREAVPGRAVAHAIRDGQLAVFAGIDPFGEWYVLWPDNAMKSAEELCARLKAHYGLKELGVIISDSKSTPLRRGVIGGAIGWAGFTPLFDNRKRLDLTGKENGGSQINVADAVAAAAVLVMGEGVEQTPLVVVRNAPYAFLENVAKRDINTSYVVPREEDIFAPFFNTDIWKRGGRKEA
jgi:F420-0:gamma-glutamyl ligase